jgi:tRNA (guanine26-N2/guanine27-N2)-dimethyltransferase
MYKIISEGETQLYVPVKGGFGKRGSGKEKKPPVFYNPHMALNRSLCVGLTKAVGKAIVFADVLAGSGAKGLRVAVESGNEVALNDANPDAVRIIKKNARLNKVKVKVSNKDANAFLLENKNNFDFIDIDPFGSPVPFIDSAVLASKKKGFIGATATDTATLCGVYPMTCLRRYQAAPLRTWFCHEIGLRILVGYLVRSAAKYDCGIKPLLCHSTRHYLRLYSEVKKGVKNASNSLGKLGYLYYCSQCHDITYEFSAFPHPRTCECGVGTSFSGPLWLGALQEKSIVEKMQEMSQSPEAEKLLWTISQETSHPFYYNVHFLARAIGGTPPGMEKIIQRLKNRGFQASRTHFSPVSIKTNADVKEVKKSLH